ncbi:MAG: aldolase catalytic domain-containing protein [Treponema sp.]|nr:aldolase catalytic domain-containing protein [Treponema sp.]
MNKIRILDCTLRDGGYCNEWRFGRAYIGKIIRSLTEANVDIIECGYILDGNAFDPDVTKFSSISQVNAILPEKSGAGSFVIMANYGDYDFNALTEYSGKGACGIRLAFHKKDAANALREARVIAGKGYKLFLQPMVSLCYTDEEFLRLIHAANELNPYAFYIVDSFGEMKGRDLRRLFYMTEHNLRQDVMIGFHSHNNMQLAYSNAKALVETQTSRSLIIDSSVYGMGRGAGNLNTELFTEYLNETCGTGYDIKPLLSIIDEVLSGFYQQKSWGYSLPNYLSALHSVHPSYAFFLDERKTLTVEDMNEIFLRMSDEKKHEFDRGYIESLYESYMEAGDVYDAHKAEFLERISGKEILLIGPGKSSETEKETITDYAAKENVVSISVNFDYPRCTTDFVFISNIRRFREFPKEKLGKCIITSNIAADGVYLQAKYRDLLNDVEVVRDNAGLMAVRFLMDCGVRKVILAGFDGYSHDNSSNYAEKTLSIIMNNAMMDAINDGMTRILAEYGKQIEIVRI